MDSFCMKNRSVSSQPFHTRGFWVSSGNAAVKLTSKITPGAKPTKTFGKPSRITMKVHFPFHPREKVGFSQSLTRKLLRLSRSWQQTSHPLFEVRTLSPFFFYYL